jgi:uncharacterized protein (TIGR03435 family)
MSSAAKTIWHVSVLQVLLIGVGVCQTSGGDKSVAQEFEVAAVRPSGPDRAPHYRIPDRGTVSIVAQEIRTIIAFAYNIDLRMARFRLQGGSDRVLSRRYDITAKIPEDAPSGETRTMLRSLLADRFKLRVHTEVKQVGIYELVVKSQGHLGPFLKASENDCQAYFALRKTKSATQEPVNADGRGLCTVSYAFNEPKQGDQSMWYAGPIRSLVDRLQPFLDRPLVDSTGLVGNFEWTLSFSRSDAGGSDFPWMGGALEEQLGLKLERRNGPVEVLVIDHVEVPAPQ